MIQGEHGRSGAQAAFAERRIFSTVRPRTSRRRMIPPTGAVMHMANPNVPAWLNTYLTDEAGGRGRDGRA